jgi:hypothetical protein
MNFSTPLGLAGRWSRCCIRWTKTLSSPASRKCFSLSASKSALRFTSYDVMPDGQRFVMAQFAGRRANAVSEPTVVLNWLDKVRQLVAAGQSDGGK